LVSLPSISDGAPLIQVILGSTRNGRFGEKAAAWVMDRVGAQDDLVAELVDLREYPMEFYDQERPPAYGDRDYPPGVERWANRVDQADGYLVITPEYNHGYPAVLKNALDAVFPEFNRKPIAFVGYGNSGGARSIEQLRLVAIELEMAPLRRAVHILPTIMLNVRQAEDSFDIELFTSLDDQLQVATADLVWWARALARARAAQD
jgi:NAD(P)H-dependent FMN reductase